MKSTQPDHWIERKRATSVACADALGRPRPSVLSNVTARPRHINVAIMATLSLFLAFLPGCATTDNGVMHLSMGHVQNDFLLTAYLDHGYSIKGFPIAPQSINSFSGKVEVWSPDGVKVGEGFVQGGSLDGAFTTFDTNGRITAFEYFQDGESDQIAIDLAMNGTLLRQVSYMNGEKHGQETYWTSNGLPELRIEWQSGMPASVVILNEGVKVERLAGTDAVEFLRQRAKRWSSFEKEPSEQ